MIIYRLPKYRFASIFITLFLALQISACGTEEFLTAVSPEIGSNTEVDISTNNTAKISGVDTGSVIEDLDPDGDNLLEVSGKLDITDNTGGHAFIAKTVSGNYGELDIDADGNWTYTADNQQTVIQNLDSNATLTENLTISSNNGATHTVLITIIGVVDSVDSPGTATNTAAVITGIDNGSITEDIDPDGDSMLEVSGKLNISDSDAGEAAFIATAYNGNYGNLIINSSGNWNYAASNNQAVIQNLAGGSALVENLVISSVDGTTHNIKVTILGADENNVTANITLTWVAPAERENNQSISLSEIAGFKVLYGTTQGVYSNSLTINDGSATSHTFNDLPAGTYYFVVTSLDTNGRESKYSSVVTVAI